MPPAAAPTLRLSPQGRRAVMAVLALGSVVGVALGIETLVLHLNLDPFADTRIYYDAGARLNAGQPLYGVGSDTGVGWYVYPPLLAILFRPLALLPFPAAAAIWEAVIVAATVLAARRAGLTRWTAMVVGWLALPICWALAVGQAEPVVTACWRSARPPAWRVAGHIKLVPWIAAVYWLGRGDVRALGRFAVWVVAVGLVQLVLAPEATLAMLQGDWLGPAFNTRNISPFTVSPLLWAVLAAAGVAAGGPPGAGPVGLARRRGAGGAGEPAAARLPAHDAARRAWRTARRAVPEPGGDGVKRAANGLAAWLLVGAIGWAGIVWIGWLLWQQTPPRAGFDLTILLDAARRVLAGQSPYDPAMIAGTSPDATSLFYSYPPPVAQAMTLVAWLPDGAALVLWGLGATMGLGFVAWRLALAAGRPTAGPDAIRAVAVAALILPFAVAVLFGNLDAWYPLAFGALVLAVAAGPGSRRQAVAGGIALGIVAVAKLHPASLLIWLGARALVDRGGPAGRTLAAAVVTGAAIIAASLVVGGFGPWQDYVAVIRVGAGAAVIDPRNVGPVSLLGQVVPLDAAHVRLAQIAVALAAVAVTVIAAVRVRDPLASLAVGIAASLVVLPVTWYHYPVALIPVGLALVMSRPAARALVAVSVLVADIAVAFALLLWVAVGVLLAAAGARRRMPQALGPSPSPGDDIA